MRKLFLLAFVLCATLALTGCGENRTTVPEQVSDFTGIDAEAMAVELTSAAGWPMTPDELREVTTSGHVVPVEVEELGGGIVHYSYRLKIGEGQYDEIGLHRVVKEVRPGRPIKARKAVFIQHGDAVAFEGVFLIGSRSPNIPATQSFSYFLASNDIDVWGIDQNWTLVPSTETDFSFMSGWGMQNQVENLDIAISVARFVRQFTGSGPCRMTLMGYSSGAATGWSYINMETQKAAHARNVSGYIPVEMVFKNGDAAMQATACGFNQLYQGLYDGGQYADMVLFSTIGYLALTDPDGASPLAPGFTNRLVALVYGSATHMFAPFTPWYHYTAGVFDPVTQMPTGFQFVTEAGWLDFLLTSAAWEPTKFFADYLSIICDMVDVPFDDHLAKVEVPIFNVGAGGALGPLSEYTNTLVGSSDVTSHIVSLYPPEYIMADFGHIDVFLGDNAEALVWTPILSWIDTHSPRCFDNDNAFIKDE